MSNGTFKPLASLSEDDVLINFNEKLGEWTYGLFYLGHSKSMNKKVMVKVVDLRKFPLQKTSLDTEIAILKKLQNSNYVTKFVEYKYYKNTATIVTDMCNQGNLKDYMKKNVPLSEEKALPLLIQIAYGLRSLHEAKFSHGALRPENILLNEENGQLVPKISNFLFAKAYQPESVVKAFPVDSIYLAPEVIKTRKYNNKSDIWSLGVIYYEMLYGITPWTGKDMKELEENIRNNKLEFPAVEGISETSTAFLAKCLERSVEKRMDWNDLMQHRLIFRGMFSKGNGTFKIFNEQFSETPSNKNIIYGLRRDPSTKSISSVKSPLCARGNKSVGKTQAAIRCPPNLLNKNIMLATENDAKDTTEFLDIKSTIERKNTQEVCSTPISIDIKSIPIDKCFKMRSPTASSSNLTDRPKSSTQSLLKSRKTQDAKFYDSYLSKVTSPRDSYQLKPNHTHRGNSMGNSQSNFAKPLKQLCYKTEMLGEIYKLIEENQQHPLYDAILKALERESEKLKEGIDAATVTTERFVKEVQLTTKNETLYTTEGDVAKPLRKSKSKASLNKREKCKETYELLKQITSSLIEGDPIQGVNNESMVKIAANFKVLREFNGIGENVARELAALKDILLVFYRKKQFDHLKYLLLVKNYV